MSLSKAANIATIAGFVVAGLSLIVSAFALFQINKTNSNVQILNSNIGTIEKLMIFSGGGGGGALGGGGGGGAAGPGGPGGNGGPSNLIIQPTRP
jgi:hypothetical protein